MERARILVVDDRPNMLRLVERILNRDYDVTACSSAVAARAHVESEEYDLVVTDIRMPELSGMDLLRIAKRAHPGTEVILITAYGDIPQAVEAMRQGAYHYLTKPFEPEELGLLAAKALERRRLVKQTEALRREIEERYGFDSIIGESQPMRDAVALLRKAAASDSTVLLTGESGTGKELFARALHYHSARAERAFVAVNCGAIPRELLESELFGHVKGAFTGAIRSKAGLIATAEGGTIFLDEIAELDIALQVKLNRALQEREIRPVGANADKKVDVRVVAATNRDLATLARSGGFREDLFYRISVFPVRIPPLRERAEDIPLLAAHFLRKFAAEQGKDINDIEPAALQLLSTHEWRGNVRELQNVIERAVLLETGDRLAAAVIRGGLPQAGPDSGATLASLSYRDAMEAAQREASLRYIASLLARHNGNVTQAATEAGIERESLSRLMSKLGLRSSDFRK